MELLMIKIEMIEFLGYYHIKFIGGDNKTY